MADFSISISNSLGVLGPAPTNKWGTPNWGSFLWGARAEFEQDVGKFLLDNATTITESCFRDLAHLITNSFSLSADMTEEQLQTSNGYYKVFRRPSDDAEDRTLASWTDVTEPSDSFSEVASVSTTWS